jgi:Calx-beta domain-containing protein
MLGLVLPFVAALLLVPGATATIPPQRDPVTALSIADSTAAETNFDIIGLLEVTLSAPTDDAVTVHWATVDGTADSTDYVPESGTLTIPPRQTSARIAIMVKGDALDEPDETVYVDLSDANGATIARARGTLTITDDDPAPFRLLDAYVDARWSVHRRYTRVTKFAIHKPADTVAAVRCRGAGCPVRVGRKLLPGAVVTVRIEAPYKPLIGRMYQYKIRAGKRPLLTSFCLPPGGGSPERC